MFSAGYGPDAAGRVAARFGPVGQEGGENRLNVAITRARTGVHVLASFTPDMLDVSGARHLGPRLLRLYFDYVYQVSGDGAGSGERVLREVAAVAGAAGGQAGAAAGGPAGEGAPRVGRRVQAELAAALEHAGLVVARDVGIGPHRLDLAVRRGAGRGGRDRGARWDLGVDCTRFLATADPVQRDVTEPAFWRRAGWRMVRVSPALWLERRDAVVQAILELVAR